MYYPRDNAELGAISAHTLSRGLFAQVRALQQRRDASGDRRADEDWTSRSISVYRECGSELEHFRGLLENDTDRCFEIRLVDGLFLFTKSGDTARTLERLGTGELCECFAQGRKVFVIPKRLSKGLAVRALAKRLGLARSSIVCAGDSLVDVPMLNEADTALFTDNIPSGLVAADIKHRRPQEGFTEFVTEFASKLNA